MNEPWREILLDHFGWGSLIELFSAGFSRRQTFWKSCCWRTSIGDLEALSGDFHPGSGGNRPSSHTIKPIGGLGKTKF